MTHEMRPWSHDHIGRDAVGQIPATCVLCKNILICFNLLVGEQKHFKSFDSIQIFSRFFFFLTLGP